MRFTAIGVAWSVIRPVLTMVVFTVVFGGQAGLPSDKVMITKVDFPRLASPTSAVGSFVDFLFRS
jgi:hypothetical protein